MSKYGPRVLPEGRSVLADALGGLAGGFRQGMAVREHRDDRKEQAIDRTRRRGREDVTWEQQDELHGFAVEDQEFDRFDRSRDIERDPMFTTDPAQAPGSPAARNPLAEAFGGGPSPGQYVPGVGFLPPMVGGAQGRQEAPVEPPMAGAQEGPQTRTPEPFARVGDRDIYRTGATRESILADELERELGARRETGELDNELAIDRFEEQEGIRSRYRERETSPEQERQRSEALRADQVRRVGEYANFLMTEGNFNDLRQFGRVLQAKFPDLDPAMVSTIARQQFSGEAPPTFRMNGRDFPDTEQGQADALEWRGQVSEQGGSGGSGAADLLAGLGLEEEESTPRRSILPGGKQPAMAAEAGGDRRQQMWDEAAAALRQQGRDPVQIIGPRP